MLLDADEMLALPFLGERIARGAEEAPVGRPGERFVSPLAVPNPAKIGRFYFLFGSPISAAGVDASDRDECAALYASVKAELQRSIDYLLERRAADPYQKLLPRAAVEASWNWERQAPSFDVR